MITRGFRNLGIDNNNDVLLGHVLNVVIIDDLNKYASFGGALLLIVYTGLGIWEKFKKLTSNKENENETDSDT
ncbi:MAG: hypothetical protein MUF58_11800 [Arcicella sp.]|jgi:hypothetical protein|nr:hypothetical protein [Arcicella sp.]